MASKVFSKAYSRYSQHCIISVRDSTHSLSALSKSCSSNSDETAIERYFLRAVCVAFTSAICVKRFIIFLKFKKSKIQEADKQFIFCLFTPTSSTSSAEKYKYSKEVLEQLQTALVIRVASRPGG